MRMKRPSQSCQEREERLEVGRGVGLFTHSYQVYLYPKTGLTIPLPLTPVILK